MDTIGNQTIWGLLDDDSDPRSVSNESIRRSSGHFVSSYVDLAQKIASLQFLNREHVLLFRGQKSDYKNASGLTTIKPTIFRASSTMKVPSRQSLQNRFSQLKKAEEVLVERYRDLELVGADRLSRYRLLRWSILQHYDVCPTPLLDVSQSLRIAASFATSDGADEGYVYVLAVPNLSGAVTASSEASMQIVRLSSACPPSAMRPHLQEGYLLGEYPEIGDVPPFGQYKHAELDFGRRLVAKLRFNHKTFWKSDAFPPLSLKALYPTGKRDPLEQLMIDLKDEIEGDLL